MVTVTSPETAPGANVTVAFPSALVTLPPAGVMIPWPAGGERPLAVFAVGSGALLSHGLGADVAPSPCVEGVVAAGVPSPEPDDAVPTLPTFASVEELLGQLVTLGPPPLVLVPLTTPTVPAGTSLDAMLASIVPLGPVPSVLVELVRTVSETVPLPPVPIMVCWTGGVVVPVESVASDEI